jgi:hypothetical protein
MTPLKGIATLTRLLVERVPGIVRVIVCGAIIADILSPLVIQASANNTTKCYCFKL